MRYLSLSIIAALMLSACGDKGLPPLPSGQQTVAAILLPAELSAVRRGSHVLSQDGVHVYYAESSLVNLREYEHKRVTLRGRFEHNTNPQDLPVLVVDTVIDVEETTKLHVLAPIQMNLTAPVQWKLVEREGAYQFFTDGETQSPILSVNTELSTTLPDGGVPIVVDALRAVRLVDDLSGGQVVIVKRDEDLVYIEFAPGSSTNAERLREDFLTLLTTVEFIETTKEPDVTFGTGALGTPCGGVAGILCPEGSFCDIQDFAENIGRCRKL